jgi:YD repeat-containing protein
VYQTLTYAVNPTTGAVGNALISNSWYDPSGNLLQQIAQGDGQVFTKQSYNGVNWVISSYRGYNTTGTSYSQASTVTNDIIVEQTDNMYDEAGNLVSAAVSQRLNDASTSTMGALTSAIARISYTAGWFDGIDRSIASANYGAIASFTRPSTPPASSATVLVNLTAYNNGGEASQVTDPMGNITQTSFDDAGRTISQMIAKNPIAGDQVTTWNYGTTLAGSGVARNDLLASVAYPDSTGGSDVVSYAYNRQGQQRATTDQRGTIHTLYYDKLARQTNDCVTTVGSNTDSTVLQIARAYDIRGMVSTLTSTNSATQGAGTVLNQVQLTYNSFGQLIEDDQAHTGAVSGSTPSVQYAYDSGSSNEVRLNQLIYPNGRTVSYNFASGMDSTLNRVTSISDTSATLAGYTYLGIGTVVRITYPQPGIWLDLWGGTSGTFNGIDQFGRAINQLWQNNITATPVAGEERGS